MSWLSGFKTYLGGAVFLCGAAYFAYEGDMAKAAELVGLALTTFGLRHAIAKNGLGK